MSMSCFFVSRENLSEPITKDVLPRYFHFGWLSFAEYALSPAILEWLSFPHT